MTKSGSSGPSATLRLFFLHLAASFISAAVILGGVYAGVTRLLEAQIASVVEAELRGLVDDYREGGQFAIRAAIARRTQSREDDDAVYLYATGLGVPLAGNLSAWPDIPLDGRWRKVTLVRTDIARKVLVGGRAFSLSGGARLFVGRDLRAQREFREILMLASGALLVFFLASGTFGGLAVSRTVLKRVKEIEEAAQDIVAGDLSRRAPVSGAGDEFDRLAISLNAMLERNEALVDQLRTVTDSLAHDLRTPLARLRTKLETAAREMEERHADATPLEEALAEADYMQSVFSALIDIARAEAGLARDQFELVDLGAIVRDAADLYSALAEERSQSVEIDAPQPIFTKGHAQFLARAAANLLDNAVKFSPDGALIRARAYEEDGRAVLEICDQGPGVAESDWPAATRRFGRLQKERAAPGAGLGLSLVATVAEMHGAELRRRDNAPGLCVSMVFPREASSGSPA